MAAIAVISIAGSFLAAIPAGKLVDRFGSVQSLLLGGLVVAGMMISMPRIQDLWVFFSIVPFYGMAQQLYNVASLATITAALPDPKKRARDMGGWGAIQSAGAAVGALFGGLMLTVAGDSDKTASGSNRTRYTRDGYTAAYMPAGVMVLVSVAVLWPHRHRLRGAPPPPTAAGSIKDNNNGRP